MVFFRNFEGRNEIQNQSAVGNAEVRTNLFEKIPSALGGFLLSVFFFDYPKANTKTIWTT
jgi:hypothetical protein